MSDYEFSELLKKFSDLHKEATVVAREIMNEVEKRKQSYHMYGVDVTYSPDQIQIRVSTEDGRPSSSPPLGIWN